MSRHPTVRIHSSWGDTSCIIGIFHKRAPTDLWRSHRLMSWCFKWFIGGQVWTCLRYIWLLRENLKNIYVCLQVFNCVNPLNAVNPRNEMRTFSLQLLNFYQRGLWSKPYYELIPTFRVAGSSECLTTITDMTLKTLYSVIPRNKSTWSSIPEYRVNSKPPYPYWHDTMVPIIIW